METSCRTGADQDRSYNGHYMEAGKKAEVIIMQWLEDNPQVVGVEDLRSLRQMREADVDVSLCLYDGRIALAEIKSDWHLGVSGNVLFEVLRINHTCNPEHSCTLGWSARSPARWLLFYAPQMESIYRLTFAEYRNGMQRATQDKDPIIRVVRTDRIKTTINLLIPEKYFPSMLKYVANDVGF